EIRYDDALARRYRRFLDTEKTLGQERSRITSFFKGDPEANHAEACQELATELGLHL
ncbi:MAG: hypothetical protein GWO16_00370, partial [Gammaproteobacteria bacterium]|nr:hypothetical protein [Gammaproteobacteria bacterium]